MEGIYLARLIKLSGDVLELGCGVRFSSRRFGSSARVVATDVDPRALSAAEARTEKGLVSFRRADAQCLPFDSATFDTVVASFLFCSVERPQDAMREIERVLRPDGRFVSLEHIQSRHFVGRLVHGVVGRCAMMLDRGCHLDRNPLEFGTSIAPIDIVISSSTMYPWQCLLTSFPIHVHHLRGDRQFKCL